MYQFHLKVITTIALLLLLSCSGSKQFEQKKELEIISFSSQRWNGGIPNVGGVNYEIRVVSLNPIVPDSLWINNNGCSLSLVKFEGQESGDTLIFKGGTKIKSNKPTLEENANLKEESVIAPVVYEGVGVFSYYEGKQRKFKVLEHVEIKETINYK